MEFVRVKGNEFIYQGQSIRFAGLGIGSWLNLEHFMLGIPTPEKQMKEAARMMEYEYAAALRDQIIELRGQNKK